MVKSKLMPTIVLSAICVAVALLLAGVNTFTLPRIEAAQAEKANAALIEVLPGGGDFEEIPIEGMPTEVTAAYKSSNGGYVFQMTVTGYKPGLVIMCGIDSDGKIAGAKFIQSNETLSAEVGLGDKFVGYDRESITTDIIAGPTAKLTTNAYYQAIEAALNAFEIANGGSVDLRTPEEILQDNCNDAMGSEGVRYEKWFAYEALGESTEIYTAEDGSAVVLVGETYVGIKNDGSFAKESELSAEIKEKAKAAYGIYSSAELTEVVKPEGVSSDVEKIYVSGSGNYLFELRARGYGIVGDKYASGEFIKLKLVIGKDGRIMSILTTYQKESPNVGDVTIDPEYYEQYNGKGASDYESVATVSGATVSTTGYKNAIKIAFEAYEILKGGN
ncbi:MAG: FMN-binding protein [Ruminococcaceae bacterium]|nr:FMN-binding protein [Oscillospiraceae bacterium]